MIKNDGKIYYACEFYLNKNKEHEKMYSHDYDIYKFLSSEIYLYDSIEFSCDFYFEDERISNLKDGEYIIYVHGTAEFESNVDWESGIDEGGFILNMDALHIKKYKGEENNLDGN